MFVRRVIHLIKRIERNELSGSYLTHARKITYALQTTNCERTVPKRNPF